MKNFKFLLAATTLVGMVACSSDDFDQTNGNYELSTDGTEVFVTVDEQESSMRAGFANAYNPETGGIRQQFLWAEGDVFKMYCNDTWKPQLYQFKMMATVSGVNGAVFDWAEDFDEKYHDGEKAEVGKNREYAVFPAKGNENGELKLEFKDEFRTALTMTIPSKVDYGTPSIVDQEYAKEGKTENMMDDMKGRMYVSNTLIPLFGFAEGENVTFKYLTALLCVDVQGIASGEHTLTLESQKKMLSGTFETEDFDAASYTTASRPVFTAKDAESENERSLTIKFMADNETLGTDYFIYIPVPVGKYDAGDLSLTLDKDGEDKRELTITSGGMNMAENETTVEVGKFLRATTTKPVVAYVTTLDDLNDIFAGFGNVQREAIYHIWGGSADAKAYFNIEVPELYMGDSEEDATLSIPELAAPVTVYLHGAFTAPEGQNHKTLYIKGKGNGKKLTLNICDNKSCTTKECEGEVTPALSASTAEIEISNIPAIELDGAFKGLVKIKAQDLTIGGTFENGMELQANILTLKTLTADIVTAAMEVNIAGTVTGNITAEDATEVEILRDGQLLGDLTAENAAVTVNGTLGGTPKHTITSASAVVNNIVYGNIVTSGKTTVNDKYASSVIAGSVEINKVVGTISSITATGNVVISNDANATLPLVNVSEGGHVTLGEGSTITILNLTGGNLTATKATVTTLNLKGGNVTMTDGVINTLAYTTTEDAAAPNSVTTSGAADIKNVTVDGETYAAENIDVLTFTSTWTGETVEMTLTDSNTAENYIFTAAQLANVVSKVKAFALHTDITIGQGQDWASLGFKGNFYGNGHTITGLNNSLFSVWNCSGDRVRTIKDIKFVNANVENGVLVNNIINTITNESALIISGIEIENATISGTDYAAALVGTVSGNITFEGNKVTSADVEAKSNLGALAGKTSGNISFVNNTVTKAGVHFTVTDADKLERALETGPGGTVGYYVGTIEDGTVSITDTATDLTFTPEQKKAFGFDKNVTTGLQGLVYYGFEGCGWVGFSKGATDETLKVNNKAVKINVYSTTALTNN